MISTCQQLFFFKKKEVKILCNIDVFVFRKLIYYTQSATFMSWLALIILAASLSLIVGAIFWDVPSTDKQLNLNDRQGYHYSVMCIVLWPVLLYLTVLEVTKNRKTVQRDIKDGLYSRSTYIVTKVSAHLVFSLRKF